MSDNLDVITISGDLLVADYVHQHTVSLTSHCESSNQIKYRYNEDKILKDIANYLDSTYGQHYASEQGLQVVDIWESIGSLDTTARDTAIKYLMRYGKKDGRNRKDLLKAIHYIILMLYVHDKETA